MADRMDAGASAHDGSDRSRSRGHRSDDLPQADFEASELSADELEAAYLRALESSELEEWDSESFDEEADLSDGEPEDSFAFQFTEGTVGGADSGSAPPVPSPSPNELYEGVEESTPDTESAFEHALTADADFLSGSAKPSSFEVSGAAAGGVNQSAASVAAAPFATTPAPVNQSEAVRETDQPAPTATRIIEACLFVGGQPLSAKKLASVLESTGDASQVEILIDELNQEYAAQHRPYEIRLGDGGYRLALRSEFEIVRNRVYGVGPRDVKLSQDILEVLAFVAYQQPIAHAAVEACGKPNVANILRQLLRRELITLNRIDQSRNGVEYRTTNRFLQVFGLGNLNELPRPEDLALR